MEGLKLESQALAKLALPTIVMTASQQAMVFTDQIFLGHLGTNEFAAAALGNMYSAFLQFFLFGTATALDTLGATAYGAHKKGLPGTSLVTWCFTSFMVLTMLCIPVTVGLSFAHPVAKLLGQDDTIALLMSEFCKGLRAGVWPMMWSICLIKYLQVQNVVISPAIVTFATFISNIGLNVGFIALFGFRGAPMATSFARTLQFVLMCLLVVCFQKTLGTSRKGLLAFMFRDADQDIGANGAGDQQPAVAAVKSDLEHQQQGVRYHHSGQQQQQQQEKQPGWKAGRQDVGAGPVELFSHQRHLQQYYQHQQHQLQQQQQQFQHGPELRHETHQHGGGSKVEGFQIVQQAGEPSTEDSLGAQARDLEAMDSFGVQCSMQPGDSGSLQGKGHRGGLVAVARRFGQHLVQASHPSLLWAYLKLGIPGGLMMAFEQMAFDVTTGLAGRLGPAVVAAHSAFLNIIGLTFVSCPFAVGIAGSIRVGNLLGSGAPHQARLSGWLCVGVGGTFMGVFACIILAASKHVGKVFSNDPAVISVMASIAPLAALFQVSDGVMGTAQGVLRGCGKQTLLMFYNLVGFWMCGVLLGAFLCFKAGMGVIGLWWGIASGDTVTGILNVVTLYCVNWPNESQHALQVLQHAAGQQQQQQQSQPEGLNAGEEADPLIPSQETGQSAPAMS